MSRRLAALTALGLALLARPLSAQLIWPGEAIATIDAEHLRAFVPFDQRDALLPVVARADRVYARMLADAGFTPSRKLELLVSDWVDTHNGYSFVTPFPLVEVELAPALAPATIFHGGDGLERTLVHEFAHQISNDRNHGFRGALESVFGRILPNDLLSLGVWYLSTPAHQTMPRFWQEGLGTWAETEYADPNSAWGGRGRDPLVHMVWRLDAADDAIPAVEDWRITWHEWPFGNRAYLYGTAYTRHLAATLPAGATMWSLVDAQARSWPWMFDRGTRSTLGTRHRAQLEAARAALMVEQRAQLARLRSEPITTFTRLTPDDMLVGAPAFDAAGDLVFAARAAQGRPRLHVLHRDGSLTTTARTTQALADVRRSAAGDLVYHEFDWRTRAHVQVGDLWLGERLLQPDVRRAPDTDRGELVAIELIGAGRQQLVRYALDTSAGRLDDPRVVPTEGRAWSPTFRPGHAELAWVETDGDGSRLVLAPLDAPTERTVLATVRGRILHPCWSRDGRFVYLCADDTGVANAYRIDATATEPVRTPITNTLGGVIACVPSPADDELAFVAHDRRGPFLARTPLDPTQWPQRVPELELAWPAPLPDVPASGPTTAPLPPADPTAPTGLTAVPYAGLSMLRPLYWAPTTFAVDEGGYGVTGLAADPLLTHVVGAGLGVGLVEQEPVGHLTYAHLGSVVQWGVSAWRSERTFGDEVVDVGGDAFDYTETVGTAEVSAGRGLFGLERTFVFLGTLGIADHDGVDDATDRYAGRTLVSTPAFTGVERYAELTIGYDDATFFPTSYSREDGIGARSTFRHSGLGGDLDRNVAFGDVTWTVGTWPTAGHQLALEGQLGWSDGDPTLQGNFAIGGGLSRGLPRGYFDRSVAVGRHLVAGSIAYRVPVWQPFKGFTTTPFRGRQVVVEGFFDAGKVSTDHAGGDGDWFRSVGGEAHFGLEFADAILEPGVGVAWQLDGDRDVEGYFTLAFRF